MSSQPPTWSGMTPPQKAVWWHTSVGASTNFSVSLSAVTSNYNTQLEPEPDPLVKAVMYARGQKIVELLRARRLRIAHKKDFALNISTLDGRVWRPRYILLPPKLMEYIGAYHEEENSGLDFFAHSNDLYDMVSSTFIKMSNIPYKGYRPILEDE